MSNNTEFPNECSLSYNISENIGYLKKVFHYPENADIIFREILCCGISVCTVFMDGMINTEFVDDFIIKPIQTDESLPDAGRITYINNNILQISQAQTSDALKNIIEAIVSGGTVVLCDGEKEAVILDTRGYESRKVTTANNESVVRGAQEGFVENLRTNITLIRRYCQTSDLITEMITVGTLTPLRVALVYVKGITDENALSEARRRINKVKRPVVHGLGQLQQLIEDSPMSLLPQALMTERPDRTFAALTSGQFAILADNSPYALIAPCNIFTLLQSSDDSFSRWQYGTYMRLVRFAGLLIALLLPGIYVALISHHTQLIPLSLLSAIAETRVNVPFPVLAEVLIMELAFFMVNEANLRIPSQVGMSISIIGGLVLGQAAVQASIISPILIIIIALSGLGCYCMPDYGMTVAIIICRLAIELSGAFLGLYGVALALVMIICHVCSLRSFGCDFTAPLAPYRPHNPDLLIRFPAFMQKRTLIYPKNNKRKRNSNAS